MNEITLSTETHPYAKRMEVLDAPWFRAYSLKRYLSLKFGFKTENRYMYACI